jgi:ATP-dependent Lon protease
MRDFRDAKAMAQALRSSLSAKAVNISHSESLELVSKMFGVADWNTLSAQIEGGRPQKSTPPNAPIDKAARRYLAMPMRDLVPFPGGTYPVFAGRAKTLEALDQASKQQREIVIAVQKTSSVDDPALDDIYEIGVVAGIFDLVRLDDGTVKALVQVHRRVAVRAFLDEAGAYIADVENLSEGPIPEAPDLIRTAVARFAAYADRNNMQMPPSLVQALLQVRDPDLVADVVSKRTRNPGWVADIIAACMTLPISDKQNLLATLDPVRRLERVGDLLQGNA